MKNSRSDVDEAGVFDLSANLENRRSGHDNTIEAMRAAPLGILRWPMFSDDQSGLACILREAGLSRKKAVLIPPIEHQVSPFVSKGTMKDLVAAVNAIDNRPSGAGVL